MIQFPCSNCGSAMTAPYSASGASGQCPTCGTVVAVPLPVWDAQPVVESDPSNPLAIIERASQEFPQFDNTPENSVAEKKSALVQKKSHGCANVVALGFLTLILVLIWDHYTDPFRLPTSVPNSQPDRDSPPRIKVTVAGYLASPSEQDFEKASVGANSNTKVCHWCDEYFIYSIHNQKYCCEDCRVAAYQARSGKILIKGLKK